LEVSVSQSLFQNKKPPFLMWFGGFLLLLLRLFGEVVELRHEGCDLVIKLLRL
jgi:hypothetical protein